MISLQGIYPVLEKLPYCLTARPCSPSAGGDFRVSRSASPSCAGRAVMALPNALQWPSPRAAGSYGGVAGTATPRAPSRAERSRLSIVVGF